jgi:voltage-gated potassium channel
MRTFLGEVTMDATRKAKLLERFEKATELPLLVLAIAMIPLIAIPMTMDLDPAARRAIEWSDTGIWIAFGAELSFRTYLVERRSAYLTRHWFDVLIVALPFLRPLRVVRSARALRLVRVARLGPFAARTWASGRALLKRRGLQWVMLGGLATMFAAAGAVTVFEHDSGGNIQNYGTGLWWAISTITTVGYGDTFPVSPQGRAVAVILMVVGITFVSWFTANVAAFLVEHDAGSETKHVRMSDLMAKLESLEREVRLLRRATTGEDVDEKPAP